MAYGLFSCTTPTPKFQNGNGHGNILQSWALLTKLANSKEPLPRSGRGGRRFKSRHSDQFSQLSTCRAAPWCAESPGGFRSPELLRQIRSATRELHVVAACIVLHFFGTFPIALLPLLCHCLLCANSAAVSLWSTNIFIGRRNPSGRSVRRCQRARCEAAHCRSNLAKSV